MQQVTPTARQERINQLPIRPAWGHMRPDGADPWDDELLQYIKQLGVNDVLLNIHDRIMGEDGLDLEQLILVRNQIEGAGLRLNALEQLTNPHYDKIILGLDGREERIEYWKTSIRRLGQAGIPILGFHWLPYSEWSSSRNYEIRGGARTRSYRHGDFDDVPPVFDREFTESELWENYEYFINEVMPVAEEAGVKLGIHPNDPPVSGLGGTPFLFRDFESHKRGLDEIYPSPNLGLKMCFGCWSEMEGVDAVEAIRHFGEQIYFIHFRDVQTWEDGVSFHETFIDQGNYDFSEVIRTLHEAGATPALTPDHVPRMIGDSPQQHRGYGFTLGYMKGLLDCALPDHAAESAD